MPNPIVHAHDPQSSIIAAEHMERSGKRDSMKATVLAAILAHPGMTAGEIAEEVGLSSVDVRRRITDLEHDGKVWTMEIRHCSVEKTDQQTYNASRSAEQGKLM